MARFLAYLLLFGWAATVAADGPTPKYNDLMTAVMMGDRPAVEELLRLGKWVDKPDSQGATPLMAAVRLGDSLMAETLLKAGANPERGLPIARERRDGVMIAVLGAFAGEK